jgi:hypothetical protein
MIVQPGPTAPAGSGPDPIMSASKIALATP